MEHRDAANKDMLAAGQAQEAVVPPVADPVAPAVFRAAVMEAEVHVIPSVPEHVCMAGDGALHAWIDFGGGIGNVYFRGLEHMRAVFRRVGERIGVASDDTALARVIASVAIRQAERPTRMVAELRLRAARFREHPSTAADAERFERAADLVDDQIRTRAAAQASIPLAGEMAVR